MGEPGKEELVGTSVRVFRLDDGTISIELVPISSLDSFGCAVLLMGVFLGTGLTFVLPGVPGLIVMGSFIVTLFVGLAVLQRWLGGKVAGRLVLSADGRRLERAEGAEILGWDRLELPRRGILLLEQLAVRGGAPQGNAGSRFTQLSVVPLPGSVEDEAAEQALFDELVPLAEERRKPVMRVSDRPPLPEGPLRVTRGGGEEIAWSLARALHWPVADLERVTSAPELIRAADLDKTIGDRLDPAGSSAAEPVSKPWSITERESGGGLHLTFPSYSLLMRVFVGLAMSFMAAMFYLCAGGHPGPAAGVLLLAVLIVANRTQITCGADTLDIGTTVLGLRLVKRWHIAWGDLRRIAPTTQGVAGLRFETLDGGHRQIIVPGKRAGAWIIRRVAQWLTTAPERLGSRGPYR